MRIAAAAAHTQLSQWTPCSLLFALLNRLKRPPSGHLFISSFVNCHYFVMVNPLLCPSRESQQRPSFELNPGIIGLAKCLTPSTTLHSQVEAAQLAPTRRRFSHCLCRVSLSHFSALFLCRFKNDKLTALIGHYVLV